MLFLILWGRSLGKIIPRPETWRTSCVHLRHAKRKIWKGSETGMAEDNPFVHREPEDHSHREEEPDQISLPFYETKRRAIEGYQGIY